jgi:hypothetical protein
LTACTFGVRPSTRIYAHFGDKEALFRLVGAADGAEFSHALTLRPDAVPEFVGDIFDLARERPEHENLNQRSRHT